MKTGNQRAPIPDAGLPDGWEKTGNFIFDEGVAMAFRVMRTMVSHGRIDLSALRTALPVIEATPQSSNAHARGACAVAVVILRAVANDDDKLALFELGRLMERHTRSIAHSGPMNLYLLRAMALPDDAWRTMPFRDLWERVEADPAKRRDEGQLAAFKQALRRQGRRKKGAGTE